MILYIFNIYSFVFFIIFILSNSLIVYLPL